MVTHHSSTRLKLGQGPQNFRMSAMMIATMYQQQPGPVSCQESVTKVEIDRDLDFCLVIEDVADADGPKEETRFV